MGFGRTGDCRYPARRLVLALMVLILAAGVAGPVNIARAQAFCEGVVLPSGDSGDAATPAAGRDAAFPSESGNLVVLAAASLGDAFGEIAANLEAAYPGLDIVIQTGGSQALVTQLQEGAPADVLATASTETMRTAVEAGLVEGEPVSFARNRLVIVTPEDNPAAITSLNDLAGDGIKLVVANPEVPAGGYARQAICAHDQSGHAPDGFANALAANIVSEEEDVRAVLAKVQLGEADAGIVYASDQIAAGRSGTPVNAIEFPAGLPITAAYPIAALAGGNTGLANAFIAAILSPEGQAVLAGYGFTGQGSLGASPWDMAGATSSPGAWSR